MHRPVLALAVLFLAAAPAPAEPGDTYLLCPLVLEQERDDVEEMRLQVELAESRLAEAEQILGLVERLREDDAIERIVYLAAKHDRDVADADVARQRLRLKREQASLEQYEVVCESARGEGSEADRRARRDRAQRTYEQAECRRIGTELTIAEIDLAYLQEVLESVRDLSANRAASKQAVISAEQDVDDARIRVEHGRRRVEACADSEAAAGGGS